MEVFSFKQGKLSAALQKKIDNAADLLGQMKVETTDLGDSKNQKGQLESWYWTLVTNGIGILKAIVGAHFSIKIVRISNGVLEWIQPFIYPLMQIFETTVGKKENTGFIVLVKHGNLILMSVRIEPGGHEYRDGVYMVIAPQFRCHSEK